MFGAIHVGLSGLNAYSRGLQQVSNNVANLNSTGFKGSNVSFTNFVGSTSGGLSLSGRSGVSGGVSMSDPMVDFSQGDLRQTDRDLDLAVDGPGFLVLLRGDQVFYTRTGSFEVDRDGFIVLAGSDYHLAALDGSGRAVALSIDNARISPPEATTTIKFTDNLSSTATQHTISDVKVYDAQGREHVWTIGFTRDSDGTPGEWTVKVTDATGAVVGEQMLKFDLGAIDPATNKLAFTDSGSDLSVTFDFATNVSSYSSGEVSTLRASSVDGHRFGSISSVTVNGDGEIELGYSNQEKVKLGAVAIADFREPHLLEQRGGGLFIDRGDAGRELQTSASGKTGKVLSRRLEASNVDLARQFGELIIIQRGYQASSQIISAANEMIQQLFGLRGQ